MFTYEFISLRDTAKYKNDELNEVIRNGINSRYTMEFLDLWETLNNSDLKIRKIWKKWYGF